MKPYTLRDLYADLPPTSDRDRWTDPIIVELDGSKPSDSDGFAQRARVIALDFDDARGVVVLRTEA